MYSALKDEKYDTSAGKSERRSPICRSRRRVEDNIRKNHIETGCGM